MTRTFIFSALALTLLAGLGSLPTENAQADAFAQAWTQQGETTAIERCSLQPEMTRHPENGARVIILRPSC